MQALGTRQLWHGGRAVTARPWRVPPCEPRDTQARHCGNRPCRAPERFCSLSGGDRPAGSEGRGSAGGRSIREPQNTGIPSATLAELLSLLLASHSSARPSPQLSSSLSSSAALLYLHHPPAESQSCVTATSLLPLQWGRCTGPVSPALLGSLGFLPSANSHPTNHPSTCRR